jgi:hypothetical protein
VFDSDFLLLLFIENFCLSLSITRMFARHPVMKSRSYSHRQFTRPLTCSFNQTFSFSLFFFSFLFLFSLFSFLLPRFSGVSFFFFFFSFFYSFLFSLFLSFLLFSFLSIKIFHFLLFLLFKELTLLQIFKKFQSLFSVILKTS